MDRMNCLNTAEPLPGDNLLTAKFPDVSGSYMIDCRKMTNWLELWVTCGNDLMYQGYNGQKYT